MRRSTSGRTRPGVLGRVLPTGVLAVAAAALAAMVMFFAAPAQHGSGAHIGPALAGGAGPMCYPDIGC